MSGVGAIKPVFFDREDARNFSHPFPSDGAIALSPSARTAAQEAGIVVQDTSLTFSSRGHARCVAAARRTLRDFDLAVHQIDLSPGMTLMARHTLWGIACLVHRLHRTLPAGPWLIRSRTGEWLHATDWQMLQQVMLPRVWDQGVTDRAMGGHRPPLAAIYRWLTRATSRAMRGRQGGWIATSTPKLKNGLREALAATGVSLAVLQPTRGEWSDYRNLGRAWRQRGQVQRFLITPLANDDVRVKQTLESLRRIGPYISDAYVRSAWALYEPYLGDSMPVLLALATEGSAVLEALHARCTISYEANSFLATALLEAAGDIGTRRVVFNHNSQPPSGSAIADSVLGTLFRHRTWNPLVDVAVLWSPASRQWTHGQASDRTPPVAQPIRLQYPVLNKGKRQRGPFRILHAGNYQNWADFFPWVAETADEYLSGIEALATVVEKLEDIELIVRVRPKREVDAAAVAAQLDKRRNVVVCDTSQDFLEQLANSDLLVCHFSTTVEQALQMGKPVLLWGSTARYRQFESREIAPSGSSRSAVYAVQHAGQLPAMLIAIRGAHYESDLSAEEIAAYRFAPETPGIEYLAAQLASTKFDAKVDASNARKRV